MQVLSMSEALPEVGVWTIQLFQLPLSFYSWYYQRIMFVTQAWDQQSGEQLQRKGAGGPEGQRAEHELAVHLGSGEGEEHQWLCKQECTKQIKESDNCLLLSIHQIPSKYCIEVWNPPLQSLTQEYFKIQLDEALVDIVWPQS